MGFNSGFKGLMYLTVRSEFRQTGSPSLQYDFCKPVYNFPSEKPLYADHVLPTNLPTKGKLTVHTKCIGFTSVQIKFLHSYISNGL